MKAIRIDGFGGPEALRHSPSRFTGLQVALPDGRSVPLTNLVRVERIEGPVALSRERGNRMAVALANVAHALPDHGYGQIPPDTLQSICRMMTGADSQLLYWLLLCLRTFGGGSAIPSVERAASRTQDPTLRKQAQQTLEVLRARAQRLPEPDRVILDGCQCGQDNSR